MVRTTQSPSSKTSLSVNRKPPFISKERNITMKKYCFLFVILILVLANLSISATYISGSVEGIWDKSNSPYIITNSAVVPAEDSLVVAAGAKIIFDGNYKFVIDSAAVFKSRGTNSNPIIFDASHDSISHKGLFFQNSSSVCSLINCEIRNTHSDEYGGAITCIKSNPTIVNTKIFGTFKELSAGWIYCVESNPQIRNTRLVNPACKPFKGTFKACTLYVDLRKEFTSPDSGDSPYPDKTAALAQRDIYPNPFSDILHINLPSRITIFDVLGNKVAKLSKGAETWDPPKGCRSGLYFLKIKRQDENITRKVFYFNP